MYKISVIIPVYNAESTLKKAIESVISQNWEGNFLEDVEIILVDDNSSDSSLDIIKEYANKYDNISYFTFKDNSGFGGRGRNKGIELSTGEFIILMDNDDIYLENAFITLYNTIIKEKADLVGANYKTDTFKNKRLYCPKGYNQNRTLKPTKNQHIFNVITTNCSFAPWAKIYRKSFLKENNIKFLEDTQFDDAEFFIKCMLYANKFTIIPNDYVYMYYAYENSQVRVHDKIHFDARLNTMKEIDALIKNHGLESDAFITHCLIDLFLMVANLNESKKEKIEVFMDLYDFEKNFDKIVIHKIELNILNNAILNKQFKKAIFICKIYSFLYNNNFIRRIYRLWNNKTKKISGI